MDQVKLAPSKGGSTRLQELIKLENSLINQDKQPSVDLSEGNLMTLKSPTKHQGISREDIKDDQSNKTSYIIIIRPINTNQTPLKTTL